MTNSSIRSASETIVRSIGYENVRATVHRKKLAIDLKLIWKNGKIFVDALRYNLLFVSLIIIGNSRIRNSQNTRYFRPKKNDGKSSPLLAATEFVFLQFF